MNPSPRQRGRRAAQDGKDISEVPAWFSSNDKESWIRGFEDAAKEVEEHEKLTAECGEKDARDE